MAAQAQRRVRVVAVYGGLAVALVVGVIGSAMIGQLPISPTEVVGTLLKGMGLHTSWAPAEETVEATLWAIRFPRILMAVGVGAEIAIASDIRIAAESAYFQFAEVKRGIFETNGVMHRLPRLIGMGRAAHVMMTGERISAQSAYEMGLVTKVTSAESILQEGMNIAHTLAANAPISVRLVKEVLQKSYDLDLEAVMQLETEGTLECFASEDMREGVKAFLEKRAPVYKGK